MSRFLYRAGWPDRQNPKHPHRWLGRRWLYIGPWVIGDVNAWDRDLDHEWCRRCGGPNVIWSAASPLWNFVMRGNDINNLENARYNDMVCMACFVICAVEAGLPEKGWRLTLVPEPDGLVYVTPSGRTWDAERFLWVEGKP